jgi:Flp pilus assembly protein TadD
MKMRRENHSFGDSGTAHGVASGTIAVDTYDNLLSESRRLIMEDQYDDAGNLLRRAVVLEVSRPEAYNNLGAIIEMKGDALGALKYYRAATAFMPSFATARLNLIRAASWRREGEILLA